MDWGTVSTGQIILAVIIGLCLGFFGGRKALIGLLVGVFLTDFIKLILP